ncbi:ribbon-helix-helix domain-containing protein [Rhizobium sp. 21-4511-3d]
MNVKTTVTLSDEDLRFAEELVEAGRFPSVSDVIGEGLARLRLEESGEDDPVAGMADEIRRRMELPRDQFLPWDGEVIAKRIKERLAQKRGE